MALETQMIDIPLTLGVDSKGTDLTTEGSEFSEIINMRSDFTGGYLPRTSYAVTTAISPALSGAAWMVSTPTETIYTNGRTIAGSTPVSTIASAAGKVYRRGFGSELGFDPAQVSCATVSSKVLVAWYASDAKIGFQWYDPALDRATYAGSLAQANATNIVVTSGPSHGYIWQGSNTALTISKITVDGGLSTSLTVSNAGVNLTIYDVVYSSVDASWYMIYTSGATTKMVRYSLSGSTMTAGTPVTLTGAASDNVAICLLNPGGSEKIGAAYMTPAFYSVVGVVYSDISGVENSVSYSAGGPIYNLGVGYGGSSDKMFATMTTYPFSLVPKMAGFSMTSSGAITSFTQVYTPFVVNSTPVALQETPEAAYLPYVATVDVQNAPTYSSAGFGRATSGALNQSYRWNSGSAVPQPYYRAIPLVTVGSKIIIPQIWEGSVDTIGTDQVSGFDYVYTQRVVGAVIIDESANIQAQYYNQGTSQTIVAGGVFGLDNQGVSPHNAFPIPTIVGSSFTQSTAGGNLVVGSRYSYRIVKRWSDAAGNKFESVSPPIYTTITSGKDTLNMVIYGINTVQAQPPNAAGSAVECIIYRTEENGSIHYKRTSLLLALTGSSTFVDGANTGSLDFSDALVYDGGELEDKELSHVNFSTAWQGRICAITADSDYKVFYSKPSVDYYGARFADGLSIDVPHASGGLLALASMDYALYMFAKNEVYSISGQPAGATGEGGSLGTPERRFNGIGCSNPKSVLLTPKGIVFQSSKGIYLILRNQELVFIGSGPFADRATSIVGSFVDEARSEFHYTLSTGVEWVYNWEDKIWTSFILPATPIYSTLQGSTPKFLSAAGVYTGSSGSETIPITMTTSWIALSGIQGFQRVRNLMLLMSNLSYPVLTISIYTDYDDTTPVQTYSINTSTQIAVADPLQIRLNLQNQKCEALKIKIYSPTAGWGISGLSMEVGVKPGHYKPRTAPNTF
jgi:hypothetical protein